MFTLIEHLTTHRDLVRFARYKLILAFIYLYIQTFK